MTRSLARLAFLLIAILALAAGSAAAVTLPSEGRLVAFAGSSAIMTLDDGVNSPKAVRATDLRTGASQDFPVPSSIDPRLMAFGHGRLATFAFVPTQSQYDWSYQLFVSGPGGVRTLSSLAFPTSSCNDTWQPLAITPDKGVIALRVKLLPAGDVDSGICAVDTVNTHLVGFDADGTPHTLPMPQRYKKWLAPLFAYSAKQVAKLQGDKLIVFRNRPHPRIAVIDLKTQRTRQIKVRGAISTLALSGRDRLTVATSTGPIMRVRRMNLRGGAQRTVYTGAADEEVMVCGSHTAIGTRDELKIRDARGRTVFSRRPDPTYSNAPSVICSGDYLKYTFYEDCRQVCPRGATEGLLDLAKLH